MSNKKSYMNKENILSEGFFDKIKKGLGSMIPFTKKDKKSKKYLAKAEKASAETKKALQAFAKETGRDWDELEKEFWDKVEQG